ncbi:MAG: putative inorganic carbon transporter subunit DabA [Pseudobdellovibrionaceae bacterium]
MKQHQELKDILGELRPQLPIQNPIPFFVHNNPLQYWEKFKFDQGIATSCLLYERAGVLADRAFVREFEDIVIPVLSAYLDQGMRRWTGQSNFSEQGLWSWFINFVKHSSSQKSKSFYKIKADIAALDSKILSPDGAEAFICATLKERFGRADDYEKKHSYLKTLLFHFKGWSGMVHLLESNPKLFPLQQKKISLIDWLAILIMVESRLNESTGSALEVDIQRRHRRREEVIIQIQEIKKREQAFYGPILRRFESQLHELRLLKTNSAGKSEWLPPRPFAQVFFCIDDREEALRRILENVNPQIETFGTVGFFGVDVAIKSLGQLVFQPYCPPVVQPRKKAIELNIRDATTTKGSFAQRIRKIATAFNHTKLNLLEPVIALFAPLIYLASLLLRSSHLELYHRLKSQVLKNPSKTHGLGYEFLPEFSYSTEEKAKIVMDILKSSGLKTSFAPVIVMMAHGASTTNNPFQKSYGCGACSGQSGFANAKIFCSFANDDQVRKALNDKAYIIPADTVFVAAHHDTCSDEIMISEGMIMTEDQTSVLKKLRSNFKESLQQNTQFRFNRFHIDPAESPLRRSLDWSQPRPEYGHSKVALAVFGPRSLTYGMDLEGRAFLVSYDPATDLDGSELEYVIMSALPVCANINLDYFTSGAFPEAFGSGSKLPMNIVSGIGLMTGSKSDLKIGLARQMVDQHEALRLLSFVFCQKEPLLTTISKSPRLTNLIKNEWIHLVRIDPEDFSLEPITQEISRDLSRDFTAEPTKELTDDLA